MPYNEYLAERISHCLIQKKIDFISKKMMGGMCFLVDDKMLCGIMNFKTVGKDQLMARIGVKNIAEISDKSHWQNMEMNGRKMKDFILIDDVGIDTESDLEFYIDLCLKFNPEAKSSKKKK